MTEQLPETTPPPAAEAVHRLLALYRYLRSHVCEVNQHGLRGRQFSILRRLLEAGPLTVGQIGDYLFISASTASESLSRLEEMGYVTRERSAQDNRVVYAQLTPTGQSVVESLPLGGFPLLRERIKTLSATQVERINAALDDLLTMMEIEL